MSLVIKKFGATWCGPCKMLAPVLEALKEDNPDIEIQDIDVEDKHEEAAEFGVMSVPAVFFLKDGKVVEEFVGFKPQEAIQEIVDGLK